MYFQEQLKQETKTYHHKIETAPLLKKVIDANITLDEYRLLINKFYSYIKPCEILIQHLSCRDLLLNREKTPLLEQDLIVLGMDKNALEEMTQCVHLPVLVEREHVLGYLYVIEGSTLGGQVISHILHATLQLTPATGIRYFNGYGEDTKIFWEHFCHLLNATIEHGQQIKIINSVNQTYTTLYDWILN